MLVSSSQSGVPHSIASYTSPSQIYQPVNINWSHYVYFTGSKYLNYREKDIPSLCVGVFESPYTENFTRFFLYTSKLQLLYTYHMLRINELITNSSNFYIATFLCFCQFHIFIVVSVCFCNDAYLYNEMIFIEINVSCKIIIICFTCWFHLE